MWWDVLWAVAALYVVGFVLMACAPQWRGDGIRTRLLAGASWPYIAIVVFPALLPQRDRHAQDTA